jgi:hypothetical protein
VVDVDGQYSFAYNAGHYLFLFFIYFGVGIVFYLGSRKFNTNRSLRETIEKVYNMRVKWSIVWDIIWLFGLNVMVCGFMQLGYSPNPSDTAVAVISLIIFISLPCLAFYYRLKKYNEEDTEDVDNFKFIHEGLKDGKCHYITYVYFLRRVIFAAIIAGTIAGNSRTQAALLMTLSILMLLTLIIVRPYQEKLRNFMHISHEVGLTALAVGCVYYRNYLDAHEPVGTKILCG